MEKLYGVSDKHTGPWLGEDDTPGKTLAKGRAMWGNVALYVAEIRPMNPADALPNIEIMIGDMRERLVEQHGSGADTIFDDKKVMAALNDWWHRVREFYLLQIIEEVAELDHMIATGVKKYSPNHDVKVGDFK